MESSNDVILNNIPHEHIPPLFKLPLEKIFTKLGFTPHTAQIEIINLLRDNRWVVCTCGRRFGKSVLAAHLAFAKLLEPDSSVGIVAPTHGLSDIIFSLTARLIKQAGLETIKWSIKDKHIELINGSVLKGLTAQKPDSLVGRSYDLLILDECALITDLEDVWQQMLRPTLSDRPGSRALFISTPRGRNYFKKLFDRDGSPDFPGWVSFQAPTSSNPLIPKEDIEEAKATLPSVVFDQEYLALFTAFQGQVYSTINIQDDLLESLDLSRYEIIAGLDVGFNHETAAVIVATDGENFYVIDEYKHKALTTQAHANWLAEKSEEYDIYNIYIDSAAAQTAYDLSQLYDISTLKAKKDVHPGIAVVDSLFIQNKLIIDSKCEDLILELENYAWKEGKDEVIKINDDLCDALRYAIYTFYTSQTGITAG